MIKSIIFWAIFAAMLVGGFLAGGPAAGVLGCAGLWAIGGSFVIRKDGGKDRRYKTLAIRAGVGVICLVIAFLVA